MIYNVESVNEAADREYAAVSNSTKNFILYGKDVDIIKKEVNIACKKIYKEDKEYSSEIKKCPAFDRIADFDGYATIMLKNITDEDYANGYGLDFQRDVEHYLDKVESLKRYSFETEDYPGILINCHQYSSDDNSSKAKKKAAIKEACLTIISALDNIDKQ